MTAVAEHSGPTPGSTPTIEPATLEAPPDPRERIRLIVILGSLFAIGPLTIDMYLPALPAITDDLVTSSAGVQFTLTGMMLGAALGQVVIGPLSDAFGRRRPLIIGLAVHVLASLLCAVAPNVTVLGALRVLQGFGVAAAAVIASAVVRDRFSGSAAAKVFSRLLLVMGVAPVLAPTLGSEVLRWTNWRGVFVALAVLGLGLVAVAAFALKESLPPSRRRSARLVATARTYAAISRDRAFVGLVLVAGLTFFGLFAYVAGSSFVLQEQYGLDEQQFGYVFGAGAAWLIGASQLNVRLLGRFSPQQVLPVALAIGAAAGALLLVFAATGVGGLPAFLVPLWVVLAMTGLSLPNSSALALNRHGEAAGTASAMLGASQFGAAALAAPLVGTLGTGAAAMGVVITGGLVAALLVLLLVVRPSRLGPLDEPVAATVSAH